MSEAAFLGGVKGEDPDLTERQRQIFGALISLHGRTAEPVSSEALGQMPGVRWSPASIRSTLAELESMGLLARERSAGRVPTARGYRFHVTSELDPLPLPPEVVREVEERLLQASRDVEELLAEASRLLSRLTRQLGLAVATSFEQERLENLELASMERGRTLMVLSLGGGAVHTLMLQLENPLDEGELEEAAAVLREELVGLTLGEVRQRLAADEGLVEDAAVRIVARAAAVSWNRPGTTLFSAGAGEFATQPELADRGKLGSLLRMLETGPPLDRLLVGAAEGQAAVRVGLDENRTLAGLSLVSFSLPGRVRRAVGVLGPLRMDYARALAAVDVVGARLSEYL